jgi:hypothetical protein
VARSDSPRQARKNMLGAQCVVSGKVRFCTRARALMAINRLRAKDPTAPPLRSYKCPHCRDWHFTRSGA